MSAGVLAIAAPWLQLRKLISTQEDLQQQLAEQLAASQQDSVAAASQHAAEQRTLQASLDEAQTAVTALADELQVDC